MSNFVNYLESRKDDRGFMASLRCALVKAKRMRAYPYLASWHGVGDSQEARVVQAVAGLFASHPHNTDKGNIGYTCKQLLSDIEEKRREKEPGPVAKRLQYLLAGERDEICNRVVKIVLFAKSKEIAINYEQLKTDLQYWGDRVKNQWAMSFWANKE